MWLVRPIGSNVHYVPVHQIGFDVHSVVQSADSTLVYVNVMYSPHPEPAVESITGVC